MKPLFLIRGIDYNTNSAGICLMHTLAEKLEDKGEMVRMAPCKLREGSRVKIVDAPSETDDRKIILIEPEVARWAQKWPALTVRWLLNMPGKCGPDVSDTWGKDDLIAVLSPMFKWPGSILLTFGMIDHSIFNNDDNPNDTSRVLDCFYGRKAKALGGVKCPTGLYDLSDLYLSHEELASIFRKTRTLYVAEITSCAPEAALCGAKVDFITSDYEPVFTDEYRDILSWHQHMEDNANASLDNFIRVCYDRIGLREQVAV